MKKYMRVIAVLIVLSFCGTLHPKVAEASISASVTQSHDKYGRVFHTLVIYSDKDVRYHGHLKTYVNEKMADYTHKIFSGSGYRLLEGGHIFCRTGDQIAVDGYTVK